MKKKLFLLFSVFSLLLGTVFLVSRGEISFAEDDDEEYEEEEEDDEKEENESEQNKTETNSPSPTPRPATTTMTAPKTVTTLLKDGDGDGLYDNEDPHSTIPELYIVQDDNRNGIVDRFEFPSS